MGLAPLRPKRPRLLRAVGDGGVQKQIIERLAPHDVESPTGKSPHVAQVRQLERQDGDLVLGRVEGEGGVVFLRLGHVARAQDEAVALLCLCLEELLDCLESLDRKIRAENSSYTEGETMEGKKKPGKCGRTNPDEAPVATTVLTRVDIMCERDGCSFGKWCKCIVRTMRREMKS